MSTFIIETPSARSGNCLLGEGTSEAAAWADAFGPKPWGPSARRSARASWCREVDSEELEQLHEERANR